MAKKKRKAGEINSSSMADIAFLLLIFFLVTTTMDVDTGIKRVLPPWVNAEQQKQDAEVNERNVLKINVSRGGNIMVGTDEYKAHDLQRHGEHSHLSREVLDFLVNVDRSSKEAKEINGGMYDISQGVVSLQADDETKYAIYLQVQDELVHAFNIYRDLIAQQVYQKSFSELSDNEHNIIADAVRYSISEAEPKESKK